MKSVYKIQLEIIPGDGFNIAPFLKLLAFTLRQTESMKKLRINRIQQVFEDGYLFRTKTLPDEASRRNCFSFMNPTCQKTDLDRE